MLRRCVHVGSGGYKCGSHRPDLSEFWNVKKVSYGMKATRS